MLRGLLVGWFLRGGGKGSRLTSGHDAGCDFEVGDGEEGKYGDKNQEVDL